MLVSVVIPTYKRPELLTKCLQALHRQSLAPQDYELIIVSDGPDVESASAVHRMAGPGRPRMRLFELPEKKGPAAARNLGWQQAEAGLIAFTDDDCIPSQTWLEDFVKAYQARSAELVSFTGRVVVPLPASPSDYERNVAHLETADFITANCACSRSALQLVQGFDEEFPIAWREDSALEFELMKHHIPVIKLTTAVVTHPVRQAPWGISIRDQRKSMFNALLFKKYPELYRKKIASKPVWSYYAIILVTLLGAISFATGSGDAGMLFSVVWLGLVIRFIVRRLRQSDHSFQHILEMIVTSLLIPYLSVYWTIRGAIRYKVLFL